MVNNEDHSNYHPLIATLSPRTTKHNRMMEFAKAEGEHSEVRDSGLRAIVFGFSDGIITNLCLIFGVYFSSADIAHRIVILTGIAGMLAGACSMAIGEWISMRIQQEANEAQLLLESSHIKKYPKSEEEHFLRILKQNGLSEEVCQMIARDLSKSSVEQQVKWHALLELGIDPEELGGSPWKASLASFIGFFFGALSPLLPWLCTQNTNIAFWVTIAITVFSISLTGFISGWLFRFATCRIMIGIIRQLILVTIACTIVIIVNRGVGSLYGSDVQDPGVHHSENKCIPVIQGCPRNTPF